MFRLVLACVIAVLGFSPFAMAEQRMRIELLAESRTPRPGDDVALAIHMTPSSGWHGYWLNTGDAGMPDKVDWQLPDGFSVSPLSYPVPGRLVVAGMMNYVFKEPYALLGRLTVPSSVQAGTPFKIAANIDYLVCSDTLCVPEKARITLHLRAGDGSTTSASRARFDSFKAALPRPLGADAHFVSEPKLLRLSIPLAAASAVEDAYFYPADRRLIVHSAQQRAGIDEDRLVLELQLKEGATVQDRVDGILTIHQNGTTQGLQISALPGHAPLPHTWLVDRSASTAAQQTPDIALIALSFLAAVAGGLLLNAMPCVFPILSLKALSLVRSGESNTAARSEALAYSAGVILSCIALGALILGLRQAGMAVGWAFQLQNPLITLILLFLVLAIGLNLAGLFSIAAPSLHFKPASYSQQSEPSRGSRSNIANAFGTGVLAAVIATPCTGPFMGAALGSALILPTVVALGIFAGLGIGLALPFILIAYIPALRRSLPKPGPWMETFRNILSVPMLLTAVGLAWVLGRQAGVNAMATGLAGCTLLALSLWWVGKRQKLFKRSHIALATLALSVIVSAVAIARMPTIPGDAASTETTASHADIAFNEQTLTELIANRSPVFLYFTADWCLTCKVNEKAAIDREATRKHFAEKGITVMRGDWTNGAPDITRFLERHGRSGVPLYLYYPSGSDKAEVLPQLLTPTILEGLN